MKNETISGIGSSYGGEIESLHVEGIGKLKRSASIQEVSVEGLLKVKAKLDVHSLKIEGVTRCFSDVKANSVQIEGILKLRRASLLANCIQCEGVITSTKEVNADNINIDGLCSIYKLFGDSISIRTNGSIVKFSKSPFILNTFIRLYLGRSFCSSHSLVDIVECTSLTASSLKAKTVRANRVHLTDHCIIDKLYCDGEILVDDTCVIGEIVSKNPPILNINDNEEESTMPNPTIEKILNLYKNEKINTDQAEKMLLSLSPIHNSSTSAVFDLPWKDDGKLRVVAFIGRRLLKKGEEQTKNLEISLDCDALNVDCYGNLTCQDVRQNASAGGSIHAKDISGNVSCGNSITCHNIHGNVAAGGSVCLQSEK